MTERTVEARGTRMFVREHGEGPPVVLLHGFPQTGECWRLVAPRLAERHRVIVPDLPGFGRSGRPLAYDAATVAGVLAAFMDAVEAPKAAVVGHDWGGSLAFALALAAPERVTRLVVTNAPFRRLDLRRGFHFVLFNIPVLPEVAFRVAGKHLVAFALRAASGRKEVFDDEAVRPYQEAYARPENVSSALAYYRTITRTMIARRLRPRRPGEPAKRPRAIEVPTLIVWGMRDPVLPPSLLEGIERDIPGARIVRLEECGHFVPEEGPDDLAGEIDAFLGSD